MPEIGWGDFDIVDGGDSAVLIIRYDSRNNSVLFVHNLAGAPREVSFRAGSKEESSDLLVNLLSEEHSRVGQDGKHHLVLEAYLTAGFG